MRFELADAADTVASFGLLVLLALAYAWFSRNLKLPRANQLLLGLMFGAVAALEMFRPIEPTPGLIIDMRNVPIALAGAFLGWRGALAAVAVAASVRFGIGGVGMIAGLVGLAIAASAGVLWARVTRRIVRRRLEHFVLLGALTCLHLCGGLILPDAARTWFYSEAALPLATVNMVAVPIVGLILEWVRCTLMTEKTLRAAARIDPESGLLKASVFRRECMIRATATADGAYTQAACIRLGNDNWTFGTNDTPARRRLLAAMRLRLRETLEQSRLAGVHGDDVLLIPLLQNDLINASEFASNVKRVLCEEPFRLADGVKYLPSITVDIITISNDAEFQQGLRPRLRRQSQPVKPLMRLRNRAIKPVTSLVAARNTIEELNEQGLDQMFHKAEFLMNHDTPKRRAG